MTSFRQMVGRARTVRCRDDFLTVIQALSDSEPGDVLVIDGGYIQAVARVNEIALPRGATVLNLVGKTVIPGLIDAHAHLTEWAGPRFLAWGVTTVRDLSDDSAVAYALKRRFNDGTAPGPRVFTSGGMKPACWAARRSERTSFAIAATSRNPVYLLPVVWRYVTGPAPCSSRAKAGGE